MVLFAISESEKAAKVVLASQQGRWKYCVQIQKLQNLAATKVEGKHLNSAVC